MANGNPSFNNAAMFVGAASEPDKQFGSSKMSQESSSSSSSSNSAPKKKKTSKQQVITIEQLKEFIRGIVNKVLTEEDKQRTSYRSFIPKK